MEAVFQHFDFYSIYHEAKKTHSKLLVLTKTHRKTLKAPHLNLSRPLNRFLCKYEIRSGGRFIF